MRPSESLSGSLGLGSGQRTDRADSACVCTRASAMAQDGPDTKTEKARLESPQSAAALSPTATSFEAENDNNGAGQGFEEEAGGPQTPRTPRTPRTQQSGTGRGPVALKQMKHSLGMQTTDLMVPGRINMASPRDRHGAVRTGPTTRAWIPFLLLACAVMLNWVVTFALGASWQEFAHRYYFMSAFTTSLIMQSWQGIQLAGVLDGTQTAVSMDLSGHLRGALGLFAGWFGLVPAVLAYTTLRYGIDSNAFALNYFTLSLRGLQTNTVPLGLLFVFVGVHEAWLDHADPRFSAVLTMAVMLTLVAAAATVFSWEAISRNPASTEIFYDSLLSIYGLLTVLSGALRLGSLLGWVAMLSCVEQPIITAPAAALALGGYYAYIRAAARFNTWSPQFALLWALINTGLQAIVIVVFVVLSDDGKRGQQELASGSLGSSPSTRGAAALDAPASYFGGGHCFDDRDNVQLVGVGCVAASLCLALLALVVDPQVGVKCCRRKSTCMISDRYTSLFDTRPAETRSRGTFSLDLQEDSEMGRTDDSDNDVGRE